MSSNKTQQSDASVAAYLAAIVDPQQRADGQALCAMMAKATAHEAKLWGPSIVGCGVHRYKYASGREGEICALGFAARKSEMALYGLDLAGQATLFASLGKYKTGKGCVYIKCLADIDTEVLAAIFLAAARKRLT
jgi:hypothetical protein